MYLGNLVYNDEKRSYMEISVVYGKIVFSLLTKSVCKEEKLLRDARLECNFV